MAKTIFLDPEFSLNSVELVARVKSISITGSINTVDSSDVSSRDDQFVLGSQSYSMSVTFIDDTSTSPPTDDVDGTLWGVYTGAAAVPFTFRRDSAAVSATNAEYSGSVIMTEQPIIDASRGDLLERSISFSGTGAIARATS